MKALTSRASDTWLEFRDHCSGVPGQAMDCNDSPEKDVLLSQFAAAFFCLQMFHGVRCHLHTFRPT